MDHPGYTDPATVPQPGPENLSTPGPNQVDILSWLEISLHFWVATVDASLSFITSGSL